MFINKPPLSIYGRPLGLMLGCLLVAGCQAPDASTRREEPALNAPEATTVIEAAVPLQAPRMPGVETSARPVVTSGDAPVMNPGGDSNPRTSQVIFPKGKEILEVGKSYTIAWESEGIEAFDLVLYWNDREHHVIATRVLASGGAYNWVPDRSILRDLEYMQLKLVMIDSDTGKRHDQSDDPFLLQRPS